MAEKSLIPGSWVGDLRGTHVGNVFFKIDDSTEPHAVEVVINVDGDIDRLTGVLNPESPDTIQLSGVDQKGQARNCTLVIKRVSDDQRWFSGEWRLDSGAVGTMAMRLQIESEATLPALENQGLDLETPQLIVKEETLGTITLYRSDLLKLFDVFRNSVGSEAEPIFRIRNGGEQIVKYANHFFDFPTLPKKADGCIITVDAGAKGESRSIRLELDNSSSNTLWVQGKDRTWVRGTAIQLREKLNKSSSFGSTLFKKWGLTGNWFILFGLLIYSPGLSDNLQRMALVISGVALIGLITWLYRLLPSAIIYLDDRKESAFRKQIPSVLSGLVVALVLYLLQLISEVIKSSYFDEFSQLILG